MKKELIFLFIVTFIHISLLTAKPPIKFGKMTMEEMTMDRYEADTSAPAVILCRYGYFNSNDLRFTELTRIKILKKEGLDYGTLVIETYSKSNIRGITYNLENGEIIEEKLKNTSIHEERIIEDYYRMKITMPNVKVGSVIDIEYGEDFLPSEFRFQERIPVKYAELVLEESPYIRFQKQYRGNILLKSTSAYGPYIAANVPSFLSEPYMSSINNYIAKFEFEVLDINIPGRYIPFSTSWEAITKRLYESSLFGGALEGSMYLNSMVQYILVNCKNDHEKLQEAFRVVQKVRYNDYESCYASQEMLSLVYKQEYGNSADINLILIQLLRKLGYEANPVVMSTRENGFLSLYPSRDKLNYVIAHVVINGKEYLLDATDKYMPYNLLPYRALNGQGRYVTHGFNKFIPLTTEGIDKEYVTCDVKIEDDFSMKGTVSYVKSEYAAAKFRKEFKSYNSEEEYLEEFVTDKPGVEIINASIEKIDSIYLPTKETYEVEIKNQLNVFDDEIYIQPMLFEQIKDNKFKNDERKYPVDFIVPVEKTYVMKISMPEGYKVKKAPLPVKLKLPEDKGIILYTIGASGNTIQLICKINIINPLFLQAEYPYLKEFFNQIIKKQAEPVILSKN